MKPQNALACMLSVFALLHGAARAAACDAPVGRDFASTPLDKSKLSATALLKLNQEIDNAGYDVRALLILQGCQLVFERYKKGVDRDDTHALYSVTKSLTGTLVGRLLKEGKIASLDVPLATLIRRPLFVADADWEKLQAIRLEDAMRLRSGFQWKHDVKGGNPVHGFRADMLRDGIKLPLVEKPGAKFNYSDYDAALVGFAVGDILQRDLPDAAQVLLYEPMKIPRIGWDFKDRAGRYSGGFGSRLRPMDMLKIGQLYLQRGVWNDAQLLSPEFVKLSMPMDGPHEGGYGLMWWVGKNTDVGDMRFFFANGRKTQRLYVFPEWDMVVALVASLQPEDDQLLARPLIRSLRAAIDGGSQDQDALKKLEQLTAAGFNGAKSAAERIDAPRKPSAP